LTDDPFAAVLSNAQRQGFQQGQDRPRMGIAGGGGNFAVKLGGGTEDGQYFIPGLVIEKNRDDNTIKGEYKSFDFSKPLPLDSSTIVLGVNSSANRSQVITDLNAKGFAYTDTSFTKQLDKLKSIIYTVVNIVAIILMA